ncbi:MAG: ABC transporter permease [Thermotogae bacterium]|nr:ABC transporter permease [Thermotogota bacterium]
MRAWIIAWRVLRQILLDRRFFGLSVVVPLVIMFLMKLFFDTLPHYPLTNRYVIPMSAFVVHFFSFIIASVALVQERTRGTLERLFISGTGKWEVILGYLIGFLFLGTVQTVAVIFSLIIFFQLSYSPGVFFILALIIWILAAVSVMIGLFISTFARHEGHVFPFVPLVSIPSFFFSGLLIDFDRLPLWGQAIGLLYPFHYAVNSLLELISRNPDASYIWVNTLLLIFYAVTSLLVSSRTLRDVD